MMRHCCKLDLNLFFLSPVSVLWEVSCKFLKPIDSSPLEVSFASLSELSNPFVGLSVMQVNWALHLFFETTGRWQGPEHMDQSCHLDSKHHWFLLKAGLVTRIQWAMTHLDFLKSLQPQTDHDNTSTDAAVFSCYNFPSHHEFAKGQEIVAALCHSCFELTQHHLFHLAQAHHVCCKNTVAAIFLWKQP